MATLNDSEIVKATEAANDAKDKDSNAADHPSFERTTSYYVEIDGVIAHHRSTWDAAVAAAQEYRAQLNRQIVISDSTGVPYIEWAICAA
jgi:hypothetical protein